MPTFSTPEPISVTVEIEVGAVWVVASDRDDTVVEVRPSDPSHQGSVKAAEQTQTDYASGRLQVRAPKPRGLGRLIGPSGSIDLTIQVPTRSELHGLGSLATFRGTGGLGECRLKTSAGDIHLERTGPVELRTSVGAITVDSVGGHADVRIGSGDIRLGPVEGSAVIKNDNGRTSIGDISGDLGVKAANGDISVGRAGGDVVASTAKGDVRVTEVMRGSTVLKTGYGEIEVGISAESAARLDVDTSYGRIRNLLERVDSPEGSTQTLEVRAHTGYGDIIIRRA